MCLSSNVDSDDGGRAVRDAVVQLLQAADAKHGAVFAVAMYQLGCLVRDGVGCEADTAAAVTCFEAAAAQGAHVTHWRIALVNAPTTRMITTHELLHFPQATLAPTSLFSRFSQTTRHRNPSCCALHPPF